MKFGLSSSFALLVVLAGAQESRQCQRLIKTDLISYLPGIPYNTGKLNIEVEIPVNDRATLAFDGAFIYSYGPTQGNYWLSHYVTQNRTTGVLAGAEYRIFYGQQKIWEPLCLVIWPLLLQLNGTPQQYGGLYSSLHVAFQQTGSWVSPMPATHINIPQPYAVTRSVPMLLARIGFQSVSPRRIVVDQSLGIGAQLPLVASEGPVDSQFITFMYPENSLGIYPMVNYSLKVGWGF